MAVGQVSSGLQVSDLDPTDDGLGFNNAFVIYRLDPDSLLKHPRFHDETQVGIIFNNNVFVIFWKLKT